MLNTRILAFVLILGGLVKPCFAAFELDGLGTASGRVKEAVARAIAHPTLQTISRPKLPGAYQFYLESALNMTDIDDQRVLPHTSDSGTVESYQAIQLKLGTGLPYGLAVEAGFSQVYTEERVSGFNLNVSHQTFDFAEEVYSDLVPAISFSGNLQYNLSEAAMLGFTGQMALGSYHRFWLAQVGYIGQFNYFILTDPAENVSVWGFRHGIMSYWPIFQGLYLKSEIFLPVLSGTIGFGYTF